MMDEPQVLAILNENYRISVEKLEFLRDSGCLAYAAYAEGVKYFLRNTKPLFFETSAKSLDIHLFLQEHDFPVPKIMRTKDGFPYVRVDEAKGNCFLTVYEFVEGEEVDPVLDAERIGTFVGKLHHVMQEYPGGLIKRDKHYYIDRYIEQMRAKQYGKVEEFISYGEVLWERVKDLPYGYCHGDMYRGIF